MGNSVTSIPCLPSHSKEANNNFSYLFRAGCGEKVRELVSNSAEASGGSVGCRMLMQSISQQLDFHFERIENDQAGSDFSSPTDLHIGMECHLCSTLLIALPFQENRCLIRGQN